MAKRARRSVVLCDTSSRLFSYTLSNSMRAIAEAVTRCRARPVSRILVTANGWYCTKHSAGIYSGLPSGSPWTRMASAQFQAQLELPPPLEVDPEPKGAFTLDGYTVWHGRDSAPRFAIFCGRTDAGKRAWAQSRPGDRGLMEAMMRDEWVGRTGRITGRVSGPQGPVNQAEF